MNRQKAILTQREPALSSLSEKCESLEKSLEAFDRIGVAYSGGVDSTFIAWFAKEKLGKQVTAFFADTCFISAEERENAFRIAEQLALNLEVIEFDPLESEAVRNNPVDRCYFCKKEVFGRILARAREHGCQVIVDGSHAGDRGGYRPGKKALAELAVLSPLALAGLAKDEIRHLSREAGLTNWDKPSQSCLATRIPYDTPLSHENLARIEKAEEFLHQLGCIQVRVRCHGDLARIEALPSDFAMLAAPDNRNEIVKRFNELGFVHVALDLEGFRSGSWDKGLA
jgi:pyridinium-3,5-biscarboxylic acid mononucleotide sulfurtransferase